MAGVRWMLLSKDMLVRRLWICLPTPTSSMRCCGPRFNATWGHPSVYVPPRHIPRYLQQVLFIDSQIRSDDGISLEVAMMEARRRSSWTVAVWFDVYIKPYMSLCMFYLLGFYLQSFLDNCFLVCVCVFVVQLDEINMWLL